MRGTVRFDGVWSQILASVLFKFEKLKIVVLQVGYSLEMFQVGGRESQNYLYPPSCIQGKTVLAF